MTDEKLLSAMQAQAAKDIRVKVGELNKSLEAANSINVLAILAVNSLQYGGVMSVDVRQVIAVIE